MIKVLQTLHFGNFNVQPPLAAESGWRWIMKTLVELECCAKKHVHLGKGKKNLSDFLPLFNDREASSWARSRRILFLQDFIQNILLSPTLNREVLGSSQKSEENNCLPSSLFSVSTFRSSVVSPDWDTNWLCSPSDGKKEQPSSLSVSAGEWLLHRHTDW